MIALIVNVVIMALMSAALVDSIKNKSIGWIAWSAGLIGFNIAAFLMNFAAVVKSM